MEREEIREFLRSSAGQSLCKFIAGPSMAGGGPGVPKSEDGIGWALHDAHHRGVEATITAILRRFGSMLEPAQIYENDEDA